MVLSCLEVALGRPWSCARAATRAVLDVNGWKGVGRAYYGRLRNVSPDPVVFLFGKRVRGERDS